jgi:hypothetical protein
MMSEGGGESRWLVVGRTVSDQPVTVGPFEKRYAEQVLADIRNRVSSGDASTLESTSFLYSEIDLPTLGMERCD